MNIDDPGPRNQQIIEVVVGGMLVIFGPPMRALSLGGFAVVIVAVPMMIVSASRFDLHGFHVQWPRPQRLSLSMGMGQMQRHVEQAQGEQYEPEQHQNGCLRIQF